MNNDCRSRKIAVVSHCILNRNAVVRGLAEYEAVLPGVIPILAGHGFSLFQLPCPELYAAGLDRWGQVKEQYCNRGFQRSFDTAAAFAIDGIEDYLTHGFRVVLIGIDGSPSCGVNRTESAPRWGGSGFEGAGALVGLKNERGAFMEALLHRLKTRGFKEPASFGLMTGEKLESSLGALDAFLARFD